MHQPKGATPVWRVSTPPASLPPGSVKARCKNHQEIGTCRTNKIPWSPDCKFSKIWPGKSFLQGGGVGIWSHDARFESQAFGAGHFTSGCSLCFARSSGVLPWWLRGQSVNRGLFNTRWSQLNTTSTAPTIVFLKLYNSAANWWTQLLWKCKIAPSCWQNNLLLKVVPEASNSTKSFLACGTMTICCVVKNVQRWQKVKASQFTVTEPESRFAVDVDEKGVYWNNCPWGMNGIPLAKKRLLSKWPQILSRCGFLTISRVRNDWIACTLAWYEEF